MDEKLITKDPEILGGIPVFYGTRVPIQNLIDYLTGGETIDAFLDDFPSVTREQVILFLEHAGLLVIHEITD
jgi:uncharacterized protein (DUF433 family)